MKRCRNKLKLQQPKLKLQQPDEQPWICVEICSCLNEAHCLEEKILGQCKACTFGEHDLFALKLALEEALVNAVKHGNGMDPAKHVRVQYRINAERADVAIEDEGSGFNPCEVANPTDEANLERSHGRGILLMKAYMSAVVFSPSGNKVTLTKYNESNQNTSDNMSAAMG